MFHRIKLLIVYRVLRADDTPGRLARGLALGVFLAWTPAVGLHMLLALLLARPLRANARVALPVVWVSNPLTFAPIYYPNYLVGRYLLRVFDPGQMLEFDQLRALLERVQEAAGRLDGAAFWRELSGLLLLVGAELWLGSLIMGLFLGGVTYISSYRLITWYRNRTPQGRRLVARLARTKKRTA